ncbi:MAG TPA: cytochrome c oxidase subunit II [Burkholderiales bacterium]|nr:cytochrome c oxidase subunit II [Burkholderiales bacterium]
MPTRRRFIAGAGAAALAAGAAGLFAAAPAEQSIRVTARRFVFLPNVLTLKRGVPVTLEFTSADVVMGFSAPDFNVRTDIIPGQVSRLRFTPDKVGDFTFLCDVFCGDGHEGMNGTLHVVA